MRHLGEFALFVVVAVALILPLYLVIPIAEATR